MKNELKERNYYGLRDSLLDNLFFPYESRQTNTMMKTDVKETAESFEISIDVPGIEKKDVTLEFEDGYLTVTAKRENETAEKDANGDYIRRERFTGSFSRSYYVGEVDKAAIKAKLENGVLTVLLPKALKVENRRSIEIE